MNNSKTCFLIDDDIDDQEIFEIALKSVHPSFLFVTAGDGIEALHKLNGDIGFNPDVIFLDLNMPRMNGKETLQEIRKISRLSEIPIVIYSTSTDPADARETAALGADFYLEKQSSISNLKTRLTDLFNRLKA